jgi:hypothetical protein
VNLLLVALVFIQSLPVPTCLVDDIVLGTLPPVPSASTPDRQGAAAAILEHHQTVFTNTPEDTAQDWIKPAIPVGGSVHLVIPVDYSVAIALLTIPSFDISMAAMTVPTGTVAPQQPLPLLI